MKLDALMEGVPVVARSGDGSTEITGITSDSRQVKPGSLFIAIPGLAKDGSAFADPALEQGAAAVVWEKPPRTGRAAFIQTGDARGALAIIAANFFGRPAEKLSLIGVTGTSGKTTTTKMIESILDATGSPVGMIGTIEYRAGDEREVADRTTPDAIVLQEWFARMVAAKVKNGVMEVSSHALALKRTAGVPFSAAVFTNMSRDHFDFHRDFEDYYGAKRILFDQIPTGERRAVVNIEDSFGRRLAGELGARRVLSVGMSSRADVHPGQQFKASVKGLHGAIRTPFGELNLDSPLIGNPNLANWMCAIGATLAVGIPVTTVEKGIAALKAVRGRFERVVGPAGAPTVLIDYAHKPDAMDKLLRAVRQMAPDRRLVVVFGCGGDRDQGKRPLMGEIAARLADLTILTSDNPRSEDPEAIVDQIERGVRAVPGSTYLTILDRREAIARAIEVEGENAVVVVAGKGHENYQVVGDRIIHFDDREEVELAFRKHVQKNKR